MSFETMTDKSIAQEIGRRIEQMRLEQNLTQQQLADQIGLSRLSYRKLEQGAGKLENFIALLRVLGRIDLVENFVPQTVFSPLQQLELKGRQRRRASGTHGSRNAAEAEPDKELDW